MEYEGIEIIVWNRDSQPMRMDLSNAYPFLQSVAINYCILTQRATDHRHWRIEAQGFLDHGGNVGKLDGNWC